MTNKHSLFMVQSSLVSPRGEDSLDREGSSSVVPSTSCGVDCPELKKVCLMRTYMCTVASWCSFRHLLSVRITPNSYNLSLSKGLSLLFLLDVLRRGQSQVQQNCESNLLINRLLKLPLVSLCSVFLSLMRLVVLNLDKNKNRKKND